MDTHRDDELLILVDAKDRALGPESRRACHAGDGKRHRAFSVYLFDERGCALLQQRQTTKLLWPGFYSNSCCSHPRWGEELVPAVVRRVREELGIDVTPREAFRFEYQARFQSVGSEHELVTVFLGRATRTELAPNPEEVSDLLWIEPAQLDAEIDDEERYTPWFRIAWRRIRAAHWNEVEALG